MVINEYNANNEGEDDEFNRYHSFTLSQMLAEIVVFELNER